MKNIESRATESLMELWNRFEVPYTGANEGRKVTPREATPEEAEMITKARTLLDNAEIE